MTFSRFFILAVAASSLALGAMGCSKATNGQKAASQNQQPQSGPAWALTLQSACVGSVAQDQCLAKYGFTVDATGSYRVGPGPQGQLRTGQLSDAEFGDLKTQIQATISAQATRPEGNEGHEADVENESDDTLTLSKPGASARVLAHNTAGDFYFTTASSDDAKSLHAAIHDLANSYYRLPFGDACGDGVDKFAAAAAGLTGCQTDSDCVYIDTYQGFDVVPPASVQWLLTEDCTAIQPPVVANKLAIEGGAQTLMDLYTSTRTSCGAEFSQSALGHACSYIQKATSSQPVCAQNHCQSRL